MISHKKNIQLPIYMDYQAATPLDPRVLKTMLPYFKHVGNPHSRHFFGLGASKAIEEARAQIAKVINADPTEIIFTSGATESNNLALKGLAYFYGSQKRHIITVQTEHKCILDTCRHLEREGFQVTYLSVNRAGIVSLADMEQAIRKDTLVISIMAINNEIGVIQPLKEVGKICKAKGVFFHTDAAQAFGKIPLDVKKLNINLMSISSHKIYGPTGIGALFVQKAAPRIKLEPLINGGGQERGMRSGTLSPPLIVGFGKAAEIAQQEMASEYKRLQRLKNMFFSGIKDIPEISLNGHKTLRWPGNINISFACIEGESMMLAMPNLAVSSGSACTSVSLEPSYVLRAIGIDQDLAHTSIRFGIGRFTTEKDVRHAVRYIKQAVTRLRRMSPLWDPKLNKPIFDSKWS